MPARGACRYEISRRPEVEARVAAELDQAGLLACRIQKFGFRSCNLHQCQPCWATAVLPARLPHCVLSCRRYEISRRPEVEAKVMAELDQAGLLAKPGRPHPRALELDDLARLPYLSWASKVRRRCRRALVTRH